MTTNVTIIGTSNSIMKDGWTRFFADHAPRSDIGFENRSLGGSSSRYGAYMLSSAQYPTGTDRIVLDFYINNQMFLDSGALEVEHVLASYANIATAAWRQGALDDVLVLMFPQLRYVSTEVESALFDRTLDLFDALDIAYLDCRQEVHDWVQENGMAATDAFVDPRHYAVGFQQRIADRVLEWVVSPRSPARHPRTQRALRDLPHVEYRDLDVVEDKDTRREVVGTSLMQRSTFRFQTGDRFRLSGAPYLAAVLVWTHKESGGLVFRSTGGASRLCVRRDLHRYFLFDTLTPLVPVGERLQVDVSNDGSVPPYRGLLGLRSSVYDDRAASVEIAAFIGCDNDPLEVVAHLEQRVLPGP